MQIQVSTSSASILVLYMLNEGTCILLMTTSTNSGRLLTSSVRCLPCAQDNRAEHSIMHMQVKHSQQMLTLAIHMPRHFPRKPQPLIRVLRWVPAAAALSGWSGCSLEEVSSVSCTVTAADAAELTTGGPEGTFARGPTVATILFTSWAAGI